jgi:hypothetical protein
MNVQKSDMSVGSWTVELKEELYNIALAFVWSKQQECKLRDVTKTMTDRCTVDPRMKGPLTYGFRK